MKRKREVTLFGSICLMLVLAVLPFVGACAPTPTPTPAPAPAPTPAPAPPKPKPIVLKGISFLPKGGQTVQALGWYAEALEKQSKGELTINWVGGPESIPGMEQPEALRKGVVDVWIGASSWYGKSLGVGEAYSYYLTEIEPWEERERGFNDFLFEPHKKAGVYYVSGGMGGTPMYYWFVKPIKSLDDIKGLKAATTGAFIAPWKALGGIPVMVPRPEQYTALERGLVNALGAADAEIVDGSLYEQVHYWIDYEMWRANLPILMNFDSWNQLPQHLKDAIEQAAIETEFKVGAIVRARHQRVIQTLLGKGMKPVGLSREEGQRYIDTIKAVRWKMVKDNTTPESYAKIRELLLR